MANDIITAAERKEWKRIFEHAETSKLIGWKTDWQLALEARAQTGWPRTLAALEAAEAEIERLYVLCDWWVKEEGLQRQLAEKAEAENARLRELCDKVWRHGIKCECYSGGLCGCGSVELNARLRAAAKGKETGT